MLDNVNLICIYDYNHSFLLTKPSPNLQACTNNCTSCNFSFKCQPNTCYYAGEKRKRGGVQLTHPYPSRFKMFLIDTLFILYCIYGSLLGMLYLLVIWVILKVTILSLLDISFSLYRNPLYSGHHFIRCLLRLPFRFSDYLLKYVN